MFEEQSDTSRKKVSASELHKLWSFRLEVWIPTTALGHVWSCRRALRAVHPDRRKEIKPCSLLEPED